MKYIVYCTINTINKKIYIGVHKTEFPYKFDGYLGCGVFEKDKYSYIYSKTPFQFAVNKYGPKSFKRITLKEFDTIEEALSFEKQIVDQNFINRKDTYNATIGGGIPPICNKIIYQYDLNGYFIKEWFSITEASSFYKRSSTSIGRALLNKTPSINFLWSDLKVNKLDIKEFKIGENKIKTYLYDINGNFIKEFNSRIDCAKEINFHQDGISSAIKGSYCVNKKYYISDNKVDKFEIPLKGTNRSKEIYQYDLEGNFLKKWITIKEANNFYGTCLSIAKSIRTGGSSYGFQWSYEFVSQMENIKGKYQKRKVGQYTIDGELIKIYDSVRSAKKEHSGSLNVLRGIQKTCHNFIFKYLS